LNEFNDKLEAFDNISLSRDAHHAIEIFYILPQATYNLYWCYITIISVDKPNLDNFILEYSGKKDLSMVDKSIKERVENLYLEVISPKSTLHASSLLKCIKYMKTSKEVREDVIAAFTRQDEDFQFDEGCLYFAVY